ncbi:hypothetical protein AMK25_31065 [Micromonospora sp. TSRI0369]|nr:hypothetical protein AMK25_31065 [Micromonospora sp. TSRI0369]
MLHWTDRTFCEQRPFAGHLRNAVHEVEQFLPDLLVVSGASGPLDLLLQELFSGERNDNVR